MKLKRAFLAILGALSATAAHADIDSLPPLRPGAYASAWFVDQDVAASTTGLLKERQSFFKGRISPYRAFAVEPRKIVVAGVEVPVPAQLVGLYSDKTIGCINAPVKGAIAAALNGKGGKPGKTRLCLVDVDGDKVFDHAFAVEALWNNGLWSEVREAMGMGILSVEGVIPAALAAIDPIGYKEIDPNGFAERRNLFLYYYNHAEIGKGFSLGYLITREDTFFLRHNTVMISYWDDKQLPLNIGIMGIDFRAESLIDGQLLLEQTSPPRRTIVFFGTQPNT